MNEPLSNAEIAEWMAQLGNHRSKEAFVPLFKHFAPRIKSYLLGSGSDEQTATDLAQETMLAVWHRAKSYQPERASVSTWIFTIARNKRIDRVRRQRRPSPPPVDALEEASTLASSPYSWDAIAGEQQRLKDSIASLSTDQFVVLQKAYVEDKSHGTIAKELNVALGTVKSRLRLAIERIRVAYS